MIIRFARESDIPDIENLLVQVCNVHSNKRPDLFKKDGQKYNSEQIKKLISDKNTPIITAFDEETQRVVGYAMCVMKKIENNTSLCDMKTLYLDDLCIDENLRGKGIGKKVFDKVVEFARNEGCYNITLNVWEGNDSAKKFYEKCGFKPQKTTLEMIFN